MVLKLHMRHHQLGPVYHTEVSVRSIVKIARPYRCLMYDRDCLELLMAGYCSMSLFSMIYLKQLGRGEFLISVL